MIYDADKQEPLVYDREKIRVTLDALHSKMTEKVMDLPLEISGKVPYKTDNTLPCDGFSPYNGEEIGGKDEHYYFRTEFSLPKTPEGKYYSVKCTTGREDGWDASNPQGILYLNGYMAGAFDTNHTEVIIDGGKKYQAYNYFYTGTYYEISKVKMSVIITDEKVEKLYYDLFVPYSSSALSNPDESDYYIVTTTLLKACNLINFSGNDEDFLTSVDIADGYLEKEFYNKLCSTQHKPVVNLIGHTHIDVEWQWTRAQTKEKIQRSFANAYNLMKRYPEMRFMLSQPELYRYLKEEAPEKYQELKTLVKENRWEPEGAMWLEADTNCTGGESLIRQIIYGKKFFRDEFGIESKLLMLPDVFGYSAALPGILKGCGVDYFVTSKISWNDTNTFPLDAFMWRGLDGSEVYSEFITTQDYTEKPKRIATYVGIINASHVKGTNRRFSNKNYVEETLMTYGHGDGGGGPTKDMLEQGRRLAKGLPDMPVAKQGFILPHIEKNYKKFKKECSETHRTPTWQGEMYLELHRGTYTSIGEVKRGNRDAELGLSMLEALTTTDNLLGGEYDKEGLDRMWKLVLHDQFHDILPGSSIKEVYDGTREDYRIISEYIREKSENAIKSITSKISADGVFVYNPLGFSVSGPVKIDGKTAEVENIPAFGWSVVKNPTEKSGVTVENNTAENDFYKLTLDKNGNIASIYDKINKRDVLKKGKPGNVFTVYEDRPYAFDNWEICDYYRDKAYPTEFVGVKPIKDGTRRGFEVKKKYQNSTIVSKIWLYSKSRRIDFETAIDWDESYEVLKVAFPVNVDTKNVKCGVQFGNVDRPAYRNNLPEKAMFEFPAQKWVDMSESGYGTALLDDSKYGHSVYDGALELTLLKCGTSPHPTADRGKHFVRYSLFPHSGAFDTANVVKEAYAFNSPLISKKLEKSEKTSTLPKSFSLISASADNIIIETVKRAEDGDGIVARMYESFGGKVTSTIKLPDGISQVYLCDMLENEKKKLPVKNGTVTLPFTNFQIVTLKMK